MSPEDLLFMRHELLLAIVLLLSLIFEPSGRKPGRRSSGIISVTLFSIVTAVGFLPVPETVILGGAYLSYNLIGIIKSILNSAGLIILVQSLTWLNKPDNRVKAKAFIIMLFTSLLGMYFMLSSGNFLVFYLGLELATIPVTVLAALENNAARSPRAGIKLFIISALASGLVLYGISMIYGVCGTIQFAELIKIDMRSTVQVLGFVFFFAGMALKIPIVPFRAWTADVYEGAPLNVTSYISVVSTGVAVFILVNLLHSIFPSISVFWQKIIFISSILAVTAGNLLMLRQKSIRRFMAYSSIAQAGYIIIGIIGKSQLGMASIIFYIIVYAFSSLAAFGVISTVSNASGREQIADYSGLYRTNPRLSFAMVISLLSLAGLPPLAGFFGKFLVFTAAAEQGFFFLLLITMANVLFSLYCYLRVAMLILAGANDNPVVNFRSDLPTRISLIISLLVVLAAGFAGFIFDYIREFSYGA